LFLFPVLWFLWLAQVPPPWQARLTAAENKVIILFLSVFWGSWLERSMFLMCLDRWQHQHRRSWRVIYPTIPTFHPGSSVCWTMSPFMYVWTMDRPNCTKVELIVDLHHFFGGGVAQINLPCNYSVCLISTQIFAFHSLLVFDWTQGERESKTFYHSAAPGSLSSTYNWTFLSGLTKRHVFCAGYVQADLETDEVYAQMTLIPLHTSVSSCHLLQPITVLSFGLTSVIRL
jgi:hypothetical protein